MHWIPTLRSLARGLRALGLLAVPLGIALSPAQTLCEGRNHLSPNASGAFGIPSGESFAIRHASATRYAATRIAFFVPFAVFASSPAAELEIREHDLATTYPGALLASASFPSGPGISNWVHVDLPHPVVIDPQRLYWIGLRVPLGASTHFIAYEDVPPGPDPTTHAILRRTSGWQDGTLPFRFKYQILSTDCSDGQSAAIRSQGNPSCSGPASALVATGLPRFGAPELQLVWTGLPAGLPTELWWHLGAPPSQSTSLAHQCLVHIDLQAALAFAQAGLNPLVTTSTDAQGSAAFRLALPTDLSLRGTVISVQALAIDPQAGSGALGLYLSNALELTLGL